MAPTIHGIHHVTAVAGDPQRNIDFYVAILGLRMVKKTVNFDDPGTYHFYYGDESGSPGTLLTFFPWEGVRQGQQGVGQTGATAFAVPPHSLPYWHDRLNEHGVSMGEEVTRFGERVLPFTDPDGLPLELVAQPGIEARPAWEQGSVPSAHAIRGFHSVTLWEGDASITDRLLTAVMGFQRGEQDGSRTRYQIGDGDLATRVDILHLPQGTRGRGGAGTVHHVAWRTPDDSQQLEWLENLRAAGLNVTPVQPRLYFNSIYYREPGGVLFEIATDPPGMGVDEPLDALGQTLALPPWYETQRAMIEARLQPVRVPSAAEGRHG